MAEGERQGQRRIAAAEKKVSEIQAADMRVSVTGTVVDSGGKRLVIDDGSGKIEVGMEEAGKFTSGKAVRAIGRVVSVEDGLELQAEIVQDMAGLDLGLLERVRKLEAKLSKI